MVSTEIIARKGSIAATVLYSILEGGRYSIVENYHYSTLLSTRIVW